MNENMGNEMDIKDIITLMLSKLWIILIVAALGAAGSYCYTKFAMPLQYSSHIAMYVQSYTSTGGVMTDTNNISNSKQLTNTFVEVMKDDAVMNAVGTKLMKSFDDSTLSKCFSGYDTQRIPPASIRNCLNITSVTDTSALNVKATTQSPEVAAAICNILAEVAPQYIDDAVGVGSINTIDTAMIYPNPVGPNAFKNGLIGGMAGAMLVCLIVFLMDFFNNTIRDPESLRTRYKKAVVGEIQDYSINKKKNKDDEDHFKLTDNNVPFYITESYKSIRTNISFALSTTEKKIFAISSSAPGEGKSTTSANIAIALAQSGTKTLLIDADMRKSVQHKIFGLKNKKGLSTAVSKMNKVEECISKNVMDNLDIMTSGPIPPNPSELLASENMTKILNDLSQEYSVILLDTPPVNVVTDAMALGNDISGMIMVIRHCNTTTDDIDMAMQKIEFANMNLLGFILNGIKVKKNGKYYSKYKYKAGYGYGYGYGYGKNPDDDDDDNDNDSSSGTKEEKPKIKTGTKAVTNAN